MDRNIDCLHTCLVQRQVVFSSSAFVCISAQRLVLKKTEQKHSLGCSHEINSVLKSPVRGTPSFLPSSTEYIQIY